MSPHQKWIESGKPLCCFSPLLINILNSILSVLGINKTLPLLLGSPSHTTYLPPVFGCYAMRPPSFDYT